MGGGSPVSSAIAVACAADLNFFRHLPNVIGSAIASTTRPIAFYIFTQGVAGRHHRSLAGLFPDTDISFISLDDDMFANLDSSFAISRMTFARAVMPEHLEVDRFIYLDVDVIVRGDLAELFDTDLGDAPLAGVVRGGGVNAGVLLFDAARWRREDLGRAVLAHAAAHGDNDQSSINAVMIDRIARLDSKWNAVIAPLWSDTRAIGEDFIERAAIVHYLTGFKPWNLGRLLLSRPCRALWDRHTRKAGLPVDWRAELRVLFWQVSMLLKHAPALIRRRLRR